MPHRLFSLHVSLYVLTVTTSINILVTITIGVFVIVLKRLLSYFFYATPDIAIHIV